MALNLVGALGLGGLVGGGLLGAMSADKRRKAIEKVANTPGVDLASVYGDLTKAGMSALPGASDLSSGLNESALVGLNGILNQAIPGYSGLQESRIGSVGEMLKGEIPGDVSSSVRRNAVSKSVEGGYGGSGFADNLVARDLGLTSLDILGQGMQGFESILRSTPLPRMTQANDLLDVTGSGMLGVRSNERSKKLDILTGAANSPSSMDVLGSGLTKLGGMGLILGGL